MAEKIRYDIDVNARDGVRELDRLGKAGQDAGRDLEDSFDKSASAADKAAAAIVEMAGKMDAELRGSISAADALAQALGPELTAKMDVDQVVADLSRMGLTFDEIRADADKFAAALKQVDDINLRQLGDGLDTTRNKLDTVRSSSDQSRSVLANLAGNAAQDLGELGGVVGSLGVGIGQLAEYAVDGNIALGNLAKVAGPLAGISLALAAVGAVTGANAKKQEQYNALTDAFTDALGESATAAEAVGTALSENQALFAGISKLGWEQTLMQRIPIVSGMVDDLTLSTEENIAAMAKAGISVNDWSQAVAGSNSERSAFIQSLVDMADAGVITQEEMQSLSLLFADHRTTLEKTTASTQDWAAITKSSTADVNAALTANAEAVARTSTNWRTLLADIADGQIDTGNATAAWNALRIELGLTEDEMHELTQQKLDEQLQADADAAGEAADKILAVRDALAEAEQGAREYGAAVTSQDFGAAGATAAETAWSGFIDQQFAAINAAEEQNTAYDELTAAIDEAHEAGTKWGDVLFGLNSPEGQKVRDALEEYGQTLLPDIQQAYKDAGGDQEKFAQNMSRMTDSVLARATQHFIDLGLSEEEARDRANSLAGSLGLLPENIETIYELIGDEEAQLKLGLLQGAIDALPEDVKTTVTQQIIMGDYQGALATVQSYYTRHGATIPVDADISQAIQAARRLQDVINGMRFVADIAGRLAGVSRSAAPASAAPAAVGTSRALVAPAAVPTVIMPRQVPSVTINTAVIGSRYAVQRAVARSLRAHERLNGRQAVPA